MLRIRLAKNIGFCSGVKRAIDITEKTLLSNRQRVYSLGAVIHNPEVLNQLKEKKLSIVDSLDAINEPSTVILPSHGCPQHILKTAKKKNITLVDVTCPYVSSVHSICRELSLHDFEVVIIGDTEHPEVKALKDLAEGSYIIQSVKDIKEGMFSYKKIGIIAQTTQSKEAYFKMISCILNKNPMVREVHIFNTICLDTAHRQEEVKRLAKIVDVLMVVGSHTSANTKRLYSIGRKFNKRTYLIENSQARALKFIKGARYVGLISGASTPEWLVSQVVKSIKNNNVNK